MDFFKHGLARAYTAFHLQKHINTHIIVFSCAMFLLNPFKLTIPEILNLKIH